MTTHTEFNVPNGDDGDGEDHVIIYQELTTTPLARQQTTEYSQSLMGVVMVIIPIL